ncbi:MAG: hypothetical protein Q8R48_07145, partial [Candidatus Omnitrophota bacterium]|nr:hypothetical protein [Candidatus Omnitrophota bacterium]
CDEHDDIIPIGKFLGRNLFWFHELAPYLNISGYPHLAEVYRCPTPSVESVLSDPPFERDVTYLAFHINPVLSTDGTDPPTVISKVKKPSEVIFAFDGFSYGVGGIDYTQRTYRVSYGEGMVAARHSGGANVLWIDGHTSWHPKKTIINTEEWWCP